MTTPPRLQLKGIRKDFGATRALDDVDLAVTAGEVHAVIGENGAGKSTLMKILSGAHAPDAGSVILDGTPLCLQGPGDALDAGIVMIYQELNLAPDLSAIENITLGCEPCARAGWIHRAKQRTVARNALERLHRADFPLDVPVRNLSPAHQQMVEIARAVRPPAPGAGPLRVLILDEPTSSLAQADAERLFEIIKRVREQGVSILYISHFLEECERVADRFTVLRDGQTVGSGPMVGTSLDELIRLMVGRRVTELYPQFEHEPGEVALRLDRVSAGAAAEVGLELRRGEIFGVAGLVGAGRTETVRAVFGLDPLDAGRVWVGGQPSTRRRPARSWRVEGMGFVSEDRKQEGLLLGRSIEENLTLTRTAPYRRGPFLRPRRMGDAARRWMRSLDIRATGPEQRVGDLSGGNQQKVAFGRLLHHDCDILLLDEPTRGIDIGSKATIYRCIGELAASGKAILLVSSYLPELLGLCDTIGVMSRGRLVAVRPRRAWTAHDLMWAAAKQAGGDGDA